MIPTVPGIPTLSQQMLLILAKYGQVPKKIKLEKATSERGIAYLSLSDEVWRLAFSKMLNPHDKN